MWWINKSGCIEGPFSSGQIEKRIKLNMLRSLDRVSEDKKQWFYLKDTAFWLPAKPGQKPLPRPESPPAPMANDVPDSGKRTDSYSTNKNAWGKTPIPDRLRLDAPIVKRHRGIRLSIASIAVVAISFASLVATTVYMLKNHADKKDNNPGKAETVEQGKPDPAVGFNEIRDKLVIVECDESSGSGFLLEMGGKTYLMTNEHVIRSAGAPRARLLDGTPLALGSFSVATDRDLARFEIAGCAVKPLKISERMPNIGDMVVAYGNSLGGGVATESKGFVQGVGPNNLESNCEIVPGNSGGPIVAADGNVLGVAALIDGRGSEEWTTKNTRYEGAPRRFAVRFTKVAWKNIDRRRYEQQIAVLDEFETYWHYLVPYLLLDTRKVDEDRLVFNDMMKKDFKIKKFGYEDILTGLSKAYIKRNKSFNQWDARLKAREDFIQRLIDRDVGSEDGKRAVGEYDKKTGELYEKTKDAYRNMILLRKEALATAQSVLSEEPWDAPQVLEGYSRDDRAGCVEWYREGIRYFIDLMNQKLKDFDKEISQLEKGYEDEDDD